MGPGGGLAELEFGSFDRHWVCVTCPKMVRPSKDKSTSCRPRIWMDQFGRRLFSGTPPEKLLALFPEAKREPCQILLLDSPDFRAGAQQRMRETLINHPTGGFLRNPKTPHPISNSLQLSHRSHVSPGSRGIFCRDSFWILSRFWWLARKKDPWKEWKWKPPLGLRNKDESKKEGHFF